MQNIHYERVRVGVSPQNIHNERLALKILIQKDLMVMVRDASF
jgi:hypothetical protein